MQEQFGFEVEIVKRTDSTSGFEVLPKTLDRGEKLWLDELVPPLEQGLRRPYPACQSVDAVGDGSQDAEHTSSQA